MILQKLDFVHLYCLFPIVFFFFFCILNWNFRVESLTFKVLLDLGFGVCSSLLLWLFLMSLEVVFAHLI